MARYRQLTLGRVKADTTSVEPLFERELAMFKRLSALCSCQRDAYDAALRETAWQRDG
jgi:hypothetical protein